MEELPIKWQPVTLILKGSRLECECGAAAIFVTGRVAQKQYNVLEEANAWCQDCFAEAQEKIMEDE